MGRSEAPMRSCPLMAPGTSRYRPARRHHSASPRSICELSDEVCESWQWARPRILCAIFLPCSNHAARGRIAIVHPPAWRADARRSCMSRVKIAPISMRAAFITAMRDLDLTPNQGLSLPYGCGVAGTMTLLWLVNGLPRLAAPRGETIGKAIEIVIILKVFRTGVPCSPHIAILRLELQSLRGRVNRK